MSDPSEAYEYIEPASAMEGELYPDWMVEALELEPDGGMSFVHRGSRPQTLPVGSRVQNEVPDVPRRRHLYLGFESSRVPPRGFRCRVMIQLDGNEYIGEAEGPEIPGVRAEITARAMLDALQKAEGDRVELALLGARVLRVFDRPVAVVGVYGLDDQVRPLIGACLVRESIEQAAALATLQATNRWVTWEAARQASRGGRGS